MDDSSIHVFDQDGQHSEVDNVGQVRDRLINHSQLLLTKEIG